MANAKLLAESRRAFRRLAIVFDPGGRVACFPVLTKEITMIMLNRREAGRFRAAIRRCVVGRPRGLAPPVLVQQDTDGLTLSAVLDEVAIALRLPAAEPSAARLVLPYTMLSAIEGNTDGVALLEESGPGRVRCRWQERGAPKELDGELPPPPADVAGVPTPTTGQAVDPSLLAALHACGQTTGRENSRFGLLRLQLRGEAGQVVGTDGRQLLLWGGFTFPFSDNVLVPAVPVFGSRELSGERDVRIGRTGQHVVVEAGPWTVWLTIDSTSRFPDVTAVLPRCARAAKLVLDEADAAALLGDLQKALPSEDEVVPVMLDLGPRPAVRWPDGSPGRRGPLNLIRSACTGPAVAVRLDPKFLHRALALGFREVCSTSAEAPVLFRDEYRSYLVANFGPAPAPGAAAAQRPALPAPRTTDLVSPTGEEPMDPERSPQLAPSEHAAADAVLDPLTEAEALRAALAEVARRVSRLIASLRQFQKQRRALHAAWNSLRHLSLGPKEEP